MRAIYGIRDNDTNELTPQCFVSHHDSHAIRVFQEMASDERSPIGRYIDSHDLVRIHLLERDDQGEFLETISATRVTELATIITGKALRAMAESRMEAQTPKLVKEA